jgi:GNAT superfamily N-acetyltransferase
MQIEVRTLTENELAPADHLFRLAFGTFLGLPDPLDFCGDALFVSTRFQTEPAGVYGAFAEGELIGASVATPMGTFGTFGPLVLHPRFWNQGLARHLIAPALEFLRQRGVTRMGLFTFANSLKHQALYRKFDFWPQSLTYVMTRPTGLTAPVDEEVSFFALTADQQAAFLHDSLHLTGLLASGLDLTGQIRAVQRQGLGETIAFFDREGLAAFAICHFGKGTEGGSNTCYVKFGAAREGARPALDKLLSMAESLCRRQGLTQTIVGASTAHPDTCRCLMEAGFRPEFVGVTMERPDGSIYSRKNSCVLDDWR